MEILLVFFRDVLSGFVYFLYLALCVFAFFYVLGIVADRKRLAINNKLKEKKTHDIESGREAMIAAMETKQVLDVDDEKQIPTDNQNATMNSALNSMSNMPDATGATKEVTPNVVVLNSADVDTKPSVQPVVIASQTQESVQPQVQQAQEPLVIDSSSIQL